MTRARKLVGQIQQPGAAPANAEFYVHSLQRPAELIQTFADQDATPSVLTTADNVLFRTGNTLATTITNFDDGFVGQFIFVIINDNNTTIDFTASNLKGNEATDWSPVTGDFMECAFDGTNWYCIVSNVVSAFPGNIADGTANDNTLRWSGTAWVEETNLKTPGTGGKIQVASDGNTDIENRAVDLTHQDGTRRGWVGYDNDGDLQLVNEVHAAKIFIIGEDATGTQQIILQADPDSETILRADGNVQLECNAGNDRVLHGLANGGTTLYYNDVAKLITTNTGVDITGAITATTNLAISGYLQPNTATDTQLNDITHAINTDAGKVQGAMVYNTTTDNPVYATGNTDGAVWVDGAGTTVNTPV